MNNQAKISPSSLVFSGIKIKQKKDIFLFQFSQERQKRSELLLEKKP
jgi:hypothetical protein